jgi:hypothetical protein
MSGFTWKSNSAFAEPTRRLGASICTSPMPSIGPSAKSPGCRSSPRSSTHTRKPARASRLAEMAAP